MGIFAILVASMLDIIIIPACFIGFISKSKIAVTIYGILLGCAMYIPISSLNHPIEYLLFPKIIAGVAWSFLFYFISQRVK